MVPAQREVFRVLKRLYIQGGIDFQVGILSDMWSINFQDLVCSYQEVCYEVEDAQPSILRRRTLKQGCAGTNV